MLKKLVLIFPIYFLAVQATGKFAILDYPPSLEFKGNEKLDAINIGDVLAASLGNYVGTESKWTGLYIKNPFELPKSTVCVLIDGVSEIHLDDKGKTYNLVGDSAQESLNMLVSSSEAANSLVVDVDLSQGPDALLTYTDILGNIPVSTTIKTTGNLKPDLHPQDKHLLQQLATINALTDKIPTLDRRPSVLIIRISLNPITSVHGENSPTLSEALKMLSDSVENLATTTHNSYKNDVLFVVATSKNDIYSRSKRQAENKEKKDLKDELNLATEYNDDYPVIFNIILWFMVVFTFSLIAIAYAIATMDPGRDSIIYRMTSTRMKKDN